MILLCIVYYFPFLAFYYTIYFRKVHYFFEVFSLFLYNNLMIFLDKMTFYIFLFILFIFNILFCTNIGIKFIFFLIITILYIYLWLKKKKKRKVFSSLCMYCHLTVKTAFCHTSNLIFFFIKHFFSC